ncbi:MAG: hypothetical protein JWN40_1820 [Phycisphaerales bacterium]|nr:hypothetical protein [Phycisphaerales bacterium]
MPPPPLEYASAAVKSVSDVRFRLAATLLITAALLAGVVDGFLGLLYIDRLGLAAVFLIATAILVAIAILGFVSRPQPAFGLGALLSALATAAAFIAHVLVETGYDDQKNQILQSAPGPIVSVSISSDRGARLATWEITRYISAAAALWLLLLTIYLIWRRVRIARAARSG